MMGAHPGQKVLGDAASTGSVLLVTREFRSGDARGIELILAKTLPRRDVLP